MTSGMMTATVCCVAIVLMMPAPVSADPFDSLVEEDTDLGELLEDIPRLDPDNAALIEFAGLPTFTQDRASIVIAFRDSTDSITGIDGRAAVIPGLSALQQTVLDYIVMNAVRNETWWFTGGTVRSGVIHRPYDQKFSDSRYYLKLALGSGRAVTATVIGDRDPFEPQGLDYVSASATWRPGDKHLVVIGDYRPSFGQRLLFSRYSRSFLDGADTYQSNPANVANTSFDETFYLRGGYISVTQGLVTIEAFSSRRLLDATIVDGGTTAIHTDGLHTGDAPKGNLTEIVHAVGMTAGNEGKWQFGILGSKTEYDPELIRRDGERSLNDPEGARFTFLSMAGDVVAGTGRVFFEQVFMNGGEHAGIAGIEAEQGNIRGSVAVRDYSAGYRAFRSAGIQSFGSTENERGVYIAMEGSFPNRISFASSFDIARTLTRTYLSPLPRSRRRFNLRVTFPVRRSLTASIGIRAVEDIDIGTSRSSLKMSIDKTVYGHSWYGWHIIAALTDSGGRTGMYSEGRLEAMTGSVRTTFAVAGFDIPGYEARFYRPEPDVPGRSMSRPVWGRGGYGAVVTRIGPIAARYRYLRSDLAGKGHEMTVQMDAHF